MIYSVDELIEISEILEERKIECPLSLLTLANQREKLPLLLESFGQESLLDTGSDFENFRSGTIVILGATEVKESRILGMAKSLGIEKSRIEFHGDYNDGKTFKYSKLQWQANYSLVILGPAPHKTVGTGDARSAYANMRQSEGYPPMVSLGFDKPMSYSAIKNALIEAINDGSILQDFEPVAEMAYIAC